MDDSAYEFSGFGHHRAKHAEPLVHEHAGFAHHRTRHRLPVMFFDTSEGEAGGFSRHRSKHARQFSLALVLDLEPTDIDTGPDIATAADPPVKLQLVAWAKAILVLDKSEIIIRDLIEREMAGKTGIAARVRPAFAIKAAAELAAKIRDVRDEAFKVAFRLLRTRLGDISVASVSLASWAAYFAREDNRIITAAIQSALVSGDDNVEIARKVVGSMALNGVDGVTEFTRHKIAHLGRAAIKSSNLRVQGLTPEGEPLNPLKGLDPGA